MQICNHERHLCKQMKYNCFYLYYVHVYISHFGEILYIRHLDKEILVKTGL